MYCLVHVRLYPPPAAHDMNVVFGGSPVLKAARWSELVSKGSVSEVSQTGRFLIFNREVIWC